MVFISDYELICSPNLVGVGQTMAEIDAVEYTWCRKILWLLT